MTDRLGLKLAARLCRGGNVSQVQPLLRLPPLPALGVEIHPPGDGALRTHASPSVPSQHGCVSDRLAAGVANRFLPHKVLGCHSKRNAAVKSW
jgi:hypothetical protein